ncbi:GNAT family N-acetyltransferase [Plantactinospora sp. B5E13]|uniref:GNAT family N-acetyltransferase n=1 Tax=Plantactinospora sp. B5E13 TaxID=3153758 RepID=UPI00325D879C
MTVGLAVRDGGPETTALDLPYPDVYFTPGYGAAAAVPERGEWRLAHRDGDILVPYVVRRLDDGTSDAVSPYGYSGLHVRAGRHGTDLARFWADAVDAWRDQGLVTLFLRFSPLDLTSVQRTHELPGVRLTRLADTITVPVDRGPAAVWAAMEGRSRTAVRKARNTGQTVTLRPATAADVAPGSPFRQRYAETMARVGGAPGYLFPDEYYRRLVDGVGPDLHLVQVNDAAGTVVASALLFRHRQRVHYHLAGSDPRGARDGANNLLLWTVLEWAAETGCLLVHLGGGVRPDDNLFQFKRSFGGTRTPFWVGAVVVDPDRYAALTAERARELHRAVEDLESSGFFPAYRIGGDRP